MHRVDTIRHRTALFESAVTIIEREYGRELEVDDLACRIGTSRRQLQRAFADVGHTTFRSYRAEVRIKKAAAILAVTDRPVTVGCVARHVGYRGQAQFTKAFRRRTGVTPTEYRMSATAQRRGSS